MDQSRYISFHFRFPYYVVWCFSSVCRELYICPVIEEFNKALHRGLCSPYCIGRLVSLGWYLSLKQSSVCAIMCICFRVSTCLLGSPIAGTITCPISLLPRRVRQPPFVLKLASTSAFAYFPFQSFLGLLGYAQKRLPFGLPVPSLEF